MVEGLPAPKVRQISRALDHEGQITLKRFYEIAGDGLRDTSSRSTAAAVGSREFSELREQVAASALELAETHVDKAINEGRIEAKDRRRYVQLATGKPAQVREILEALPADDRRALANRPEEDVQAERESIARTFGLELEDVL